MNDNWIKYNGTGYPVPLGSEIEVQCFAKDDEAEVRTQKGKLVCYESYECNGHESNDKAGFYWKLYDGKDYFNFNISDIEQYRMIESSISLIIQRVK